MSISRISRTNCSCKLAGSAWGNSGIGYSFEGGHLLSQVANFVLRLQVDLPTEIGVSLGFGSVVGSISPRRRELLLKGSKLALAMSFNLLAQFGVLCLERFYIHRLGRRAGARDGDAQLA